MIFSGNVNISVIKQGPLHKTKLLENGKKQRKNWNVAHIVLTDTFLLFFKDAKSFANLQSGNNSKPDFCIDLKGAIVDWCSSDKSKRSNVFEVSSAILGNYIKNIWLIDFLFFICVKYRIINK